LASVVWRPAAELDVLDIHRWPHDRNPKAAADFLDRLEAKVALLRDHWLSGHPRPDIRPGARHLIVSSRLILHEVSEDGGVVEIVRVVHGRRDTMMPLDA
jgi:plasmid stabilization system protein ParE